MTRPNPSMNDGVSKKKYETNSQHPQIQNESPKFSIRVIDLLTNFSDTGKQYPNTNDEWCLDTAKLNGDHFDFLASVYLQIAGQTGVGGLLARDIGGGWFGGAFVVR
jgi:hypothetical protein